MSNQFRKPVVIGVAGTPADAAAVRLGATEAMLRDRPVQIVAGFLPTRTDAGPAAPPAGIGTARVAVVVASRDLRTLRPTLAVDERVLAGDLADVLIRCSADADVVIAPAEPSQPDGDPVVGLGERVAAQARCPVLVARPGAAPGGDVVVALDGTGPAEPLLDYGFVAAGLRGVPLRPVLAWSGVADAALCTVNLFAYDPAVAHANADRLLAEELAGWSAKYPDVVVHRHELHAADPARVLVAATTTASLIVVGARCGQTVEAVTHRVITDARCPVAVVSLADSGWRDHVPPPVSAPG